MNTQTFSSELAKLTALPKEQVQQAISIAESLDDAGREELLPKLREFDKNLKIAVTNQDKSLSDFGSFLQDAQKRMKKLDRSSAESAASAGQVEKVEKKISNL